MESLWITFMISFHAPQSNFKIFWRAGGKRVTDQRRFQNHIRHLRWRVLPKCLTTFSCFLADSYFRSILYVWQGSKHATEYVTDDLLLANKATWHLRVIHQSYRNQSTDLKKKQEVDDHVSVCMPNLLL